MERLATLTPKTHREAIFFGLLTAVDVLIEPAKVIYQGIKRLMSQGN